MKVGIKNGYYFNCGMINELSSFSLFIRLLYGTSSQDKYSWVILQDKQIQWNQIFSVGDT